MRCHKPFRSPDCERVRICNKCKKDRERDRSGLVGERVAGVTGLDLRDVFDDY